VGRGLWLVLESAGLHTENGKYILY